MPALQDWISQNSPMIYFLYGQVFFLTGFAVWLHLRDVSNLRLARHLWLLAAFGMLHGAAEWGYVFVPLQRPNLTGSVGNALMNLHIVIIALSFFFLFEFGCKLLAETYTRLRWLPLLPGVVFTAWFLVFASFEPLAAREGGLPEWFALSEVWARYLLALPGAATAAVALWSQMGQFEAFGLPKLVRDLRGSALSLGFYSVVSGLVVPKADVIPAYWFNQEALLARTGVPVQILRALCGAALTVLIIRTLHVFQEEQRRRLEAAERGRMLLEERERLGRELHDGVIQSIYAAGLGLQAIKGRVNEPEVVGPRIELTLQQLDGAIADLRDFLQGLDPVRMQGRELAQQLGEITAAFESAHSLTVHLQLEGEPPEPLPDLVTIHLVAAVQEAMTNVSKHAGAANVNVSFSFDDEHTRVCVADDGRGFDPSHKREAGHYGLRNLEQRARILGGELLIDTAPGAGCRVELTVPHSAWYGKGDLPDASAAG